MNCHATITPAACRREVSRLFDLTGRIMLTHSLNPEHAVRALQIDHSQAVALIETGRAHPRHHHELEERALLFVNALQRLEWRLHYDSSAIRLALDAPVDALAGLTIAQAFGGSLDDLRRVRRAIDTIETPRIKWYRVGH